jgi:hypothetical protein
MAHTRIRVLGLLRVAAALCCASCLTALAGCSGDEGETTPDPTVEDPPPSDPVMNEDVVEPFSISSAGDIVLTTGSARLTFVENIDHARLEIIATSPSADSMFMNLSYPRDAAVFGPHNTSLALPGQSENVAHVLFATAPEDYHYSRSGEVDLTLALEGHQISGTFSIDVSEVSQLANGGFEPVGEATPLTGSFTGGFEVLCYSTLPGHSMAVRPDGEFCEALGL